jgi:hypothetical protein
MDQHEFARQLQTFAPKNEEVKKYNVSDNFLEQYSAGYYCKPKPNPTIKIFTSDPLLMMLQQYDCSKVEVGLVSFASTIIENVEYYGIGNVDADLLSVNKRFLNVEVLDYTTPSHVIWNCAANGEKFLSALLVCAEFYNLKLRDKILEEDDAEILRWVKKSSTSAGGSMYLEFYKMLLGYFY